MAEIPTHWLHEETLGPREVGKIFDVDTRTVSRWALNGVIGFFRTPHGMRRYPVCEVKRLMAGQPAPDYLKELADQDRKIYKDKWQTGWHRDVKVQRIGGDE
jgi:hypothetical protein